MKIHLVSDLHQEMSPYPFGPPKETDIVIVAGDIYVKNRGPEFLRKQFPHWSNSVKLPIIYVPGNHEYYGGSIIEDGHELAKRAAEFDIHLLNPGHIIIEDILFTGGTLWTDYMLWGEGYEDVCKLTARNCMNDFRRISFCKSPWERFIPDIAKKLHKECLNEISIGLTRAFEEGKKSVVVTHMGPHPKSIDPRYEKEKWLNASYVSNLETFILDHEPNLWCHGHVHSSFDYNIGKTKVITNPRGYARYKNPFDQENTKFNKDLLIEI